MATDDSWKRFVGAAEAVVGLAIALRGAQALFGKSQDQQLLGRMRGMRGLGQQRQLRGAIGSATNHSVANLDERIAYIHEMLIKSSLSKETKEDAGAILGGKCGDHWCVRPKDDRAEVKALFQAIVDPRSPYARRYTRDHVTHDQFMHYRVSKKLRISDCDDMVIALGALLMSVGFHIRMRVVETTGEDSWNHIYLLVGLPSLDPTEWMSLDPTVRKPAGWQVKGANEAKASGLPRGDVHRVRDFNVL